MAMVQDTPRAASVKASVRTSRNGLTPSPSAAKVVGVIEPKKEVL